MARLSITAWNASCICRITNLQPRYPTAAGTGDGRIVMWEDSPDPNQPRRYIDSPGSPSAGSSVPPSLPPNTPPIVNPIPCSSPGSYPPGYSLPPIPDRAPIMNSGCGDCCKPPSSPYIAASPSPAPPERPRFLQRVWQSIKGPFAPRQTEPAVDNASQPPCAAGISVYRRHHAAIQPGSTRAHAATDLSSSEKRTTTAVRTSTRRCRGRLTECAAACSIPNGAEDGRFAWRGHPAVHVASVSDSTEAPGSRHLAFRPNQNAYAASTDGRRWRSNESVVLAAKLSAHGRLGHASSVAGPGGFEFWGPPIQPCRAFRRGGILPAAIRLPRATRLSPTFQALLRRLRRRPSDQTKAPMLQAPNRTACSIRC